MGLSNNLSCEAGISLVAVPNATGFSTQRFEALFPCAGALGYAVCFAPRHSSWFIYARMWGCGVLPTTLPAPFSATLSPALLAYLCERGAAGSASGQTACAIRPTLRQSWSPVLVPPRQRESSPPRLPISAPPTDLDECFFFISLVSDFLAIRFSVSSGCARRRSVSTYTAMLVLRK